MDVKFEEQIDPSGLDTSIVVETTNFAITDSGIKTEDFKYTKTNIGGDDRQQKTVQFIYTDNTNQDQKEINDYIQQ